MANAAGGRLLDLSEEFSAAPLEPYLGVARDKLLEK